MLVECILSVDARRVIYNTFKSKKFYRQLLWGLKEMKLYSYNKCGTCRKAKKLLDANKVLYDEIDITETPPSKLILKKAIEGRGIKKLFNTSGEQYKKLRMKDKIGTMSEAQALELLSRNGRLVKRPIAVDGNRITVGFDENEYKKVWSKG